MPIVTNSDILNSKTNGGVSSNELNSLDDEESFVVLERLTANDPGPLDVSIQSLHSFQPFSNSYSYPTINNVATNHTTSNSSNLLHSQPEAVPVQPLGPQFDSNNISISVEDIQKQLQEVLCENLNLKENLFQTNLAMKQHMSTVRLLQDRASEVQKNHQAKFEETKSLILQMGSEKNELQEKNNFLSGELNKAKQELKGVKESNQVFGNEMAKILAENDSLKKQLTNIQESMQTLTDNSKKASLQPTAKEVELHELADQLTRKLEGVERSRRQQEFDIDRLKAQLGRSLQELTEAQRKLALAENSLQIEKEKSSHQEKNNGSSSLNYKETFLKYNELLNQLKTSAQEEQIRCNSLDSWLTLDPVQFEISELRRLLGEEQSQNVARKECLFKAVSTINDLLSDFKNVVEELDLVKADHALKESHSLAYDEIQRKGFTEQLDVLTAKLVEKEDALAICERHLASLREAVCLENEEKKEGNENTGIYGFKWEELVKLFYVLPTPMYICSGEVDRLKEDLQQLTKEVAAKEEIIQANSKEISLLKSEVNRLQPIAETVTVFEAQAKIYQDDFEAERKARELLVAEKERLVKDLGLLQLRNQNLIEEANKSNNGEHLPTAPPANVNNRPDQPSPAPPRPQDVGASPVNCLYCPNPECNKGFTDLGLLEQHVISCLQLTD